MTDATHNFSKSNRYVIMVFVILVVLGEAINYIISLLVQPEYGSGLIGEWNHRWMLFGINVCGFYIDSIVKCASYLAPFLLITVL